MKLHYRSQALDKVVDYVASNSYAFRTQHSMIRERIIQTMREMLANPNDSFHVATMGFYVSKDEGATVIDLGIDMNVFADLGGDLVQLEYPKPAKSTASIKNYTGSTLTIEGKQYRLEEL